MPLQGGSSRAAFEHNVRTEIEAGKPQRQVLAIAYSKKGDQMSLSSMVRDCLTPAFEGPEKLLRKFSGGDEEKGVKIPMPTDPKERADYEAAIARRKAAGGGRFVGDSLSSMVRDALLPEKDLVPGTDGLADLVERVRGGIRGQVGDATAAYKIRVRQLATGSDFVVRLFAASQSEAEKRAIERARSAYRITPEKMRELGEKGIAVFRIVSSELDADQSRPIG